MLRKLPWSLFTVLLITACIKDHNNGPVEPPTLPEALADSAKLIFLTSHAPNEPNTMLTAYSPRGIVKWQRNDLGNLAFRPSGSYNEYIYYTGTVPRPDSAGITVSTNMYALNINTGSGIWSANGIYSDYPYVTRRNDSLFSLGGYNNRDLHIYNNQNGQHILTQQLPGENFGSTALEPDPDGNNIYFVNFSTSTTTNLISYNIQTKSVVWQTNIGLGTDRFKSLLFITKDKILLKNGYGGLLAFNKKDGIQLWASYASFDTPVLSDKLIYLLAPGKGLVALDIQTGKEAWTWPINISNGNTNRIFLTGNKIIVSATASPVGPFIASIDPVTGLQYWQKPMPYSFYSVIATGNHLYGLKYVNYDKGSRLMVINTQSRTVADSISFDNQIKAGLRILTWTGKFLGD